MNRLIGILLFLLSLSLLSGISYPPETAWGNEPLEPGKGLPPGRESDFNVGMWLATFFRDTISAVDGDRCPSVPSCSSYSVESFRKHGFFLGWMMTVDRLLHEGMEETKVSPSVFTRGGLKIFDPVENNDFWWYRPDRKGHD